MVGWAEYGYCASHSRFFWGLRLYLVCTPTGMPILWALANPKMDEREVLQAMLDVEAGLIADRQGLLLISDTVRRCEIRIYAAHLIRAVIFDVGECLVDETTEYGTWADWLGVPRHTFHAMFGAVIAQGRDYRETFQEFQPGFNLYAERERRAQAGQPETFGEEDLYPDVRDALAALRADGLWLGIAGNQTVRAGRILRELFSQDVDLIGTSDDWGASKPAPEFFERVAGAVPVEVEEMLYVGDRVDNDIRPARHAGLHTALVRRGPWATVQWRSAEAEKLPTFRIEGLLELSGLISQFNGSMH